MIVVAMAVFGAGALVSAQTESSIDVTPRHGVLLLHNGEVIQGAIIRSGDFYHVVVAGGEIRVKALHVETRCNDLEEGYRFKRSNLRLGTAADHLRLGQWCERHGLLDRAEEELAAAVALEPNHPMADLLRRRIEIARRPPSDSPPAAGPNDEAVSAEDLDRLIRGLPPGVVESFARDVQPVLLNHCTASGCHGPQDRETFSLMRAPAGRAPSRRVTQRNLHAVLQTIDREHPMKSPLLNVPLAPHGSSEAPIFGRNQVDQYRRLVVWVEQAARAGAISKPEKLAQDPSRVVQAVAGDEGGQVRAAVAFEPAERASQPRNLLPRAWPFAARTASPNIAPQVSSVKSRRGFDEEDRSKPVRQTPERSEAKTGDPLPGFRPRDPFDPEIFNRQFGTGPTAARKRD